MKQLQIGDASIASIIEREGPWRKPEEFFPLYDREAGLRHLAEMPPFVFDHASGRMCFTYQTFVIRTPHHTILVDTCLGDHKGFAAPLNFPKQRWLDEFAASGLRLEDIDYVMCTHLHVDHTGWNTRLIDGRWVPTFPRAKYIFHKREYTAWEEVARQGKEHRDGVFRMNCLPVMDAGQALLVDDDFSIDDLITLTPTPGHTPHHCCVNVASKGKRASVIGDLLHHPLQCREPEWCCYVDWDRAQSVQSRRIFLASVADTDTVILPVHFPSPTAGWITSDGGARWRYRFWGGASA
jgi:glyoxylase-like metal-dependent hydrolase (beta-lactamase superfamily II)